MPKRNHPIQPHILLDETTRRLVLPFPICTNGTTAAAPQSWAYPCYTFPYSSGLSVRLHWIEQSKALLKSPEVPGKWRTCTATSQPRFNREYNEVRDKGGMEQALAFARHRWDLRSIPFNRPTMSAYSGFAWWETVATPTGKEYLDVNLLDTYSNVKDFRRLYKMMEQQVAYVGQLLQHFPPTVRISLAYLEATARRTDPSDWEDQAALFVVT